MPWPILLTLKIDLICEILRITFTNNLDLDQALQNVEPDLDPDSLTFAIPGKKINKTWGPGLLS